MLTPSDQYTSLRDSASLSVPESTTSHTLVARDARPSDLMKSVLTKMNGLHEVRKNERIASTRNPEKKKATVDTVEYKKGEKVLSSIKTVKSKHSRVTTARLGNQKIFEEVERRNPDGTFSVIESKKGLIPDDPPLETKSPSRSVGEETSNIQNSKKHTRGRSTTSRPTTGSNSNAPADARNVQAGSAESSRQRPGSETSRHTRGSDASNQSPRPHSDRQFPRPETPNPSISRSSRTPERAQQSRDSATPNQSPRPNSGRRSPRPETPSPSISRDSQRSERSRQSRGSATPNQSPRPSLGSSGPERPRQSSKSVTSSIDTQSSHSRLTEAS